MEPRIRAALMGATVRSFHWRLALTSLLVAVGNAVWVLAFRPGFGLGLDEARLLIGAHHFADALDRGDLGGIASTWTDQEVIAPLLALVTAPFLLLFDDPAVAASLPVAAFSGLLVFASAELALAISDRTAAVLTGVATSCSFAFVLWARVHEQIVPAAALWVLGIALLLRSDSLRRPGLRRAAGVVLGLALLTRAMLIAFVPALLVFYAWHCRRRLGCLALRQWTELVGLTVAVASLWWAFQWRSAIDYLVPRGTAAGGFPLAPARWASEFGLLTYAGRFPVLVAFPALVGAAIRARRHRNLDLDEPSVFVAMVAFTGFVILVCVSEDFTGFELLVVPLVLAVASAVQLPRGRAVYRRAFAVAIAASALAAALPGASGLAQPTDRPQVLLEGLPPSHREIARLSDDSVIAMSERLPVDAAAVAVVFDDPFFEQAHLFEAMARLGALDYLRVPAPSAPLPPLTGPWWTDVALVLVYDVDGCSYEAINVCELNRDLPEAGFTVVQRWTVTDDRTLRLWQRSP